MTLGPWHVERTTNGSIGSEYRMLGYRVMARGVVVATVEDEADARAIALLPALVGALNAGRHDTLEEALKLARTL